MRRLYELQVRGNQKTWGWYRWGSPEHAADWRADGLEVNEVLNIIPAWVVRLGLTRLWVRLEDLFLGRGWV